MELRRSQIEVAPWVTGSSRKTTNGDLSIPAKGTALVTRDEIISQAQNGNKLLTGIDGEGSHAHWYIEDEYCRTELGFDTEDKKQNFLHEDIIKKIFDAKSQKSFEEKIKEHVITRAEKAFLMDCIETLKINDYKKISFCVNYTGMKMK